MSYDTGFKKRDSIDESGNGVFFHSPFIYYLGTSWIQESLPKYWVELIYVSVQAERPRQLSITIYFLNTMQME
jgi:hypothetical protein